MQIKEDLIHYIWKTKNFNHNDLFTTEGLKINIISFGIHNHSDGPDFLEAQIELDDIKWSGSIEMHVKSSDWHSHKHDSDPNYENTILHVVYEADKDVFRSNGEKIPCLELNNRFDSSILELYQKFDNSHWIPCEPFISSVSEISIFLAKEKMLTDRLERRWQDMNKTNDLTDRDWEETAYRLICRSFGLVHNADAFLDIALRIPLSILKKNCDNIENLEALFMGTAGLLTDKVKDEYPRRLKDNYLFLKKKYGLVGHDGIVLKHKAVRPQNFPEVALSQFIQLMRKPNVFSILLNGTLKELHSTLRVSASNYWNNHYTFDNLSTTRIKKLGISKIRIIIINAIVPMLFFMSKKKDEDKWAHKATSFLENIPSERNNIIFKWENLGIEVNTAYDSQALLELKKNYCDKKICLSCPIGHSIMKPSQPII
ncbi:MAG: DUF2851 family protein [Saprospiraceae bacterium]